MANENEYKELNENVKELTRTLRGHNGTPGMITEITLMRSELKNAMEQIVEINQYGCRFGRDKNHQDLDVKGIIKAVMEEETKNKETSKDNLSDVVTWKWLREKFAVPIILAIIIGVINLIPLIVKALDSVK